MFTNFYTYQTGPNCNWTCHTSSHKKLKMQSRDHSCIMSANKNLDGYRMDSENYNFWLRLALYPWFVRWVRKNINFADIMYEWPVSNIKTLRPEGAENVSLGSQVSAICFWKQNCIRNPKMGSKQSIPVPP